ncbi:5'-3' exonuclease [Nocardioides yefusunii]|uniref:5'-3' exonuclease n=1 Tax=Nocardioides yefusunii TaxID=2500546 RepID=A0ABW1QX61_9ACTN|nr:5'-3' exonuclease [Nocardioides yefusunii]
MTAPRLLLLDTASLYFRAYFGVPDRFHAPDGTSVNAVRGMLDFVSRLVDEYRPTHLVCAWDDNWRPQWRVDLVPTYKEHRVVTETPAGVPDVEEVPEGLLAQVPVIRGLLEAFGIAVIGHVDMEADDVIGTLATDAGMPVDVVTGDRDLFQLVDDEARVRILYTARGVSKHERVDAEWVRAKYDVEPSQYADFATMRGDASDGLPGVAGVGEKTAAGLLAEFGTLDGILEAARDETSTIKKGPRAKMLAALDYLTVAPEAVAVRRDLDLPRGEALLLPAVPADAARVAVMGETWGVASAVDRLRSTLAKNASGPTI